MSGPLTYQERSCSQAISLLLPTLMLAIALMRPAPAHAQITYTNSADATVNETVTPCSSPLLRTFAVSQIYTVSDVNIGVLMAHTYRGDLQMFLNSPGGTRIQLINNVGGTRNNFNVLYDDSAASAISAHTSNDTATAATVVPPYQRTFRPVTALSAFNGQNANGTWTLEVCDSLGGDSGTFFQSDLIITAAPAVIAVTKASTVQSDGVSGGNPKAVPGAVVRYCITITNGGPGIATDILGTDVIPANTAYVAGSLRSGANCASAATVEDDNATGADETDPYGASISGTTISISTATMANAASFAIAFNATVN